jgi:hypothetical protein
MRTQLHLGTHQRGMGMLAILFTIGLLAFFMTVLLKLGPVYSNFWTIRSIMVDVAEQPEGVPSGARGIVDMIGKRMNVNNVTTVTASDFEIQKQDQDRFQVILHYEERVHLFFNVDAIAVFDYQVAVKAQSS